jgi:hypothetical protein
MIPAITSCLVFFSLSYSSSNVADRWVFVRCLCPCPWLKSGSSVDIFTYLFYSLLSFLAWILSGNLVDFVIHQFTGRQIIIFSIVDFLHSIKSYVPVTPMNPVTSASICRFLACVLLRNNNAAYTFPINGT